MVEATVTVDAGVCRFKTVIIASMDENMDITYKVKSECSSVRKALSNLQPMPIFDALKMPFSENAVYCACKVEHAACPVPSAMIKAGEVAGEFALKKNVTFTFE